MNKKTLLLEVNDKYLKSTLFLIGYNVSILFDRKFYYQNNSKLNNNIFNYDFSWLEGLKQLLNEYDFGFDNDQTIVIYNNSLDFFNSNSISINKIDLELTKENIENAIKVNFKTHDLLKLEFHFDENKNELFYSYNLINKQFNQLFQDFVKLNGIKNITVKSYLEIESHSITKYKNKNRNIVTIDVNDYFLTFSNFVDGELKAAYKKEFGLFNILENISTNIKINLQTAKNMFENLATIPPDDVIDNRIIYTRFEDDMDHMITYTKKDLSTYVSAGVNNLFLEFFADFKKCKTEDTLIVFTGKIVGLKGFESYSRSKLQFENSIVFDEPIIGLNNLDSFITKGILNQINSNDPLFFISNNKRANEKQVKNSKPILGLFGRMFSY